MRNNRIVTGISFIGIVLTLLILSLRSSVDYEFIEDPYRKYVTEYVETLESNGISMPHQKRWTVRSENGLRYTNIIGQARGMYDDRQVLILLNPLLKLQDENFIRFTLWHELTHDIFNVTHGTTLMMKPVASMNDGDVFNVAKLLLINYLKENR
tara:strand:+ start:1887 stop:2348 length:462 start_codon:yes stop_codon:yes gene_type:complete